MENLHTGESQTSSGAEASNFEQLTNEPSFEDHIKRSKTERAQRFVDLASGGNIENTLEKMSSDTALKVLQHLNSHLRNETITKKSDVYGNYTDRMTVSSPIMGGEKEYIAPDPDLQKELFNEYFEAIKSIDDKNKKALLAYYAINNLHLFSDGNGRTSRAVYYLIKNGNLPNTNQLFEHNNNHLAYAEKGDGDDGSGRKSFFEENHLQTAETMNSVANLFLQEQMEENGMLGEDFKNKKLYTYSSLDTGDIAHLMMAKKNRDELRKDEQVALDYAISDGVYDGYSSTTSGLAMAAVFQEKGLSKTVVDQCQTEYGTMPIWINFEDDDSPERKERVKKLFAEWTPDDYRKLLKVYKDVKKQQNEMIIRFFTEDTQFDDGTKVSDWAASLKTVE